jgi:DNA-binding transcriptional ArsR family regulator
MAEQANCFDDPRLVKAMAHPLRRRILEILQAGIASPTELSRELSEPLGNVSYHIRVLSEVGLVRLVRRTERRGTFEHHYEAVTGVLLGDRCPLTLDALAFEQLSGEIAKLLERAQRLHEQTLDRQAGVAATPNGGTGGLILMLYQASPAM